MTPDQINREIQETMWRCNSCGATSDLMWWRGFSVAVCRDNQLCSEKFAAGFAEQEARAAVWADWSGYESP